MVEEDDDESDTSMVLGDDEPTNQIQASTRPTRRAAAIVKSYNLESTDGESEEDE